jgi:hypothetical protein
MSSRHFARALVLGIFLTSTAQAAWAGPHQTSEEPAAAWKLASRLWHSFNESWIDVGCVADPNGGCGTAQAPVPPAETDVGCILDPNGGCGAGH